MEFMNAVEQALRNYAQFSGRSGRKEFWYFMLFQYSILFAVYRPWLVAAGAVFPVHSDPQPVGFRAPAPRYRP